MSTATAKKPTVKSTRKLRERLRRPKKPKHAMCPQCKTQLLRLHTELKVHFFQVHNRAPTDGEYAQFGSRPRKKPPKTKGKRKRQTMYWRDRTMFTKRSDADLTPEQRQAQERLNGRGFHDGAAVPGSHIRKIDK